MFNPEALQNSSPLFQIPEEISFLQYVFESGDHNSKTKAHGSAKRSVNTVSLQLMYHHGGVKKACKIWTSQKGIF